MTLKTMLADDRTPCVCASNITTVISELLITGNKLFTWFNSNHMKANPEKNHLLLCSKNSEKSLFWWSLGRIKFTWKLLGIQTDSDLTFDRHISSICNRVGKKINAISRLVNFMLFDKRRMVMKTFIESKFHYCHLIWMFHSKNTEQ